MCHRKHIAALVLLLIAPSASAGLFKLSKNQKFDTSSLLFQTFSQPYQFENTQIVTAEGLFLSHPSGIRTTVQLGLTIPDFPIGLMARMSRFERTAIIPTYAYEAGVFWRGGTARFKGQLGISFLQEGLKNFSGRQFLIPQITLRSRFTQGRLETLQHISGVVSLNEAGPSHIHSNHVLAYLFPIHRKMHLSVGGALDVYALLGKPRESLYFSDSSTLEREIFQFLLGPTAVLHHNLLGQITVAAQQMILITKNYLSIAETPGRTQHFVRIFKVPTFNVSYSVSY